MAELNVGAILVQNGELRGVFSERDLMTRVVIAGLQPEITPVGQVMSTNIRTIDESASLEDAMEVMESIHRRAGVKSAGLWSQCRHMQRMCGHCRLSVTAPAFSSTIVDRVLRVREHHAAKL